MRLTGAPLALCLVLLFTLAQVGPVAAQQNDFGSGADAGNSFSAATLISAGSGTGYIDSTDGYDYYKISVSSGQTVSVSVTPPSTADFDLYLYDTNQYSLDSSLYGTGSTDSVDGTATSSGYFYIKVYQYSGSGTYSMTVSVSAGTTTGMSKTFYFYDSSTYNYIASKSIYWGTSSGSVTNYLGTTDSYGKISTTFNYTGYTIYFETGDNTYSGSDYVDTYSTYEYVYLTSTSTSKTFYFYDSSTYNYIANSYIYWGTSSGSEYNYLGTTNSSGMISTAFSQTGTIYFVAYNSSYTKTHSGSDYISSYSTYEYVYLSSSSATYSFYFYDSTTYSAIASKSIYWGTSSTSQPNYLGTTDSYGTISTTFSYTGQTIYFKTGDGTYSGSAYVYSYSNYVYVYLTSTSTSYSFYFYDSSTYSAIASKSIYWGTSSTSQPNYLGTTDSYGQITTTFSQTGTIYFETGDGTYSGSAYVYSYSNYVYVYLTSTSTSKTFYFYDSTTYSAIASKSIYWGTSSGYETNYLGTTNSSGMISTTFSQTGTIYFETGDATYSGSDYISSYYTYEYVYLTSTSTSKTFYFYDSTTYSAIANSYIYWGTTENNETNYLGQTNSYGQISTTFSQTGTIYFKAYDSSYTLTHSGSDWISSYYTYEYIYLTSTTTSKVFYFYDSSTYSAIANSYIYWGTSSSSVTNYLGTTNSYGQISTTFSYTGQTIYFKAYDSSYNLTHSGSGWISSYYTYEYVYLQPVTTTITFTFYDSSTWNYIASSYIYWGTTENAEYNYLGQTNSYGQITAAFTQTGTIYFKAYNSSYDLTHSGNGYVYSWSSNVYVYLQPVTTTITFTFYDSSTWSYITNSYIYWGTSSSAVTNYLGQTNSYGQISTTFSYTGTIYFQAYNSSYTLTHSGNTTIYSWTTSTWVSMVTTGVGGAQNDMGTGDDAGDSLSAATAVAAGTGTGYLDSTDTDDYYKAYLSAGQSISVSMTPPSGADFDLYLYNSSQSQVDSSIHGGATTDSVTGSTNTAGYFYIRVKRYSGYGTYSMTITVSGGTTQNDFGTGGDAGDSPSAASTVAEGSGTGYLGDTDANDYYKVSVSSGDTITVDMTPPSGSDFDLYLYNSSQATVDSSTYGGATTDSVEGTAASAGYLYIQVKKYSGSGTYSMTIDITSAATQNDMGTGTDAGNSLSAATTVAEGSGTGYIDSTDTDDYFKIYLASGQEIEVSMTPSSGADFDLYLYNSSQSQIDSSLYGSSTTDSVEGTATSSGYFYIRVKKYSGVGTYSMTITVSEENVLAESPHNYTNNYDQIWTISGPSGSENMRVHFSQIDVESGYDYVYIYDENWNFIEQYTGSYRDKWTSWVAGGSVKVRLVTDYSIVDYGFVVDELDTGVYVPPTVTATNKYAILVGINQYQNLSSLSYTVNDAQDWKNYLQGQGYTISYFLTDSNATEANIKAAIADVVAQADSDDTIVYAHSSHGARSDEVGLPAGNSVIAAYDASSGTNGFITDTELANAFSGYSGKLFVFIDACRSGGMDEVVTNAGANKTNRYMTAASGADGYGYDVSAYQNGAWTYWYLEKGLVEQGYATAEGAFTWADAQYNPTSAADEPMEFDGSTTSAFNIDP